MDAPRPQRNRIHLDVSVPADEARDRIRAHPGRGRHAALRRRRSRLWVLADPEGNKACITAWQGRDP